jgi:quercetin dioxygenase-like cupin family protein
MMQLERRVLILAVLLSAGCRGTNNPSAIAESSGAHMEISPAGSRTPTKGGSATFTGSVTVSPLFAPEHTRASGAAVTFDPGARSAWHSHPAGQTLIVTAGNGWVQEWGAPKREINAGDVVWTPPGVKHWHGATAKDSVSHIAIQEQVDGRVVDWLEHVSDAQYRD